MRLREGKSRTGISKTVRALNVVMERNKKQIHKDEISCT